jgi:two-component system, LytTR family, sensor kinase
MKKSVLIMFHLFFWFITSMMVIIFFKLLLTPFTLFGGQAAPKEYLIALLTTIPFGAVIFYSSYFSLNFFLKRYIRFGWLAFGYFLLISWNVFSEFYRNNNSEKLIDILITVFTILYFNAFGFLFRTFIEWIKDRKIKAELEKDKLTSQLELLKSQINPHFLFNTLNNIDVLIQEEPVKASAYLKKLSEILRFMLYESGPDKIPLSKEIAYINKYIDLQKIRTNNEDFVKLEISGDEAEKRIAPMIFIHFLENAFKYASNKKVENAIVIKIDISDKKLLFFCKNHIYTPVDNKGTQNGLGFQLIQKRLDLIYKNAYQLNVKEEDNWYIVTLEIQLDDH